MSPPDGLHFIRCTFCSRSPLLATFGEDESGCLFVHVKVYKQKRVFANIVAAGGPIYLQCRECNRWLRVVFNGYHEPRIEQAPLEDIPGLKIPTTARMVDG